MQEPGCHSSQLGTLQWYQAWAQPSASHQNPWGGPWVVMSSLFTTIEPYQASAPIHLIKDVKNNVAAENTVMTISNLAFHLLGPTTALIPQVRFVCCCCCLAMQHVGPSPTRDGTHVLYIGSRTLNHWSSREALHWGFLVDFNCRLFLKLHLIKPCDLQTNISDWHGSFSEMQNCRSPMRPTELESTS